MDLSELWVAARVRKEDPSPMSFRERFLIPQWGAHWRVASSYDEMGKTEEKLMDLMHRIEGIVRLYKRLA